MRFVEQQRLHSVEHSLLENEHQLRLEQYLTRLLLLHCRVDSNDVVFCITDNYRVYFTPSADEQADLAIYIAGYKG